MRDKGVISVAFFFFFFFPLLFNIPRHRKAVKQLAPTPEGGDRGHHQSQKLAKLSAEIVPDHLMPTTPPGLRLDGGSRFP